MSIIRQSAFLSFSLLMTLFGVSADTKLMAEAARSNQSTITPQSEILKESAKTKPAFQETSDALKVTQNRVKVFFPNPSRNNTNLGYVEPVWRTTQRRDLSKFAIEQLIAGPTTNEIRLGFMKPIQFSGASNCGGNFTLSVSGGVARLRFCRDIPSAGIGDDARVQGSVQATLKQFSSIRSVIVLTKQGDCLGDMSGDNLCLRRR